MDSISQDTKEGRKEEAEERKVNVKNLAKLNEYLFEGNDNFTEAKSITESVLGAGEAGESSFSFLDFFTGLTFSAFSKSYSSSSAVAASIGGGSLGGMGLSMSLVGEAVILSCRLLCFSTRSVAIRKTSPSTASTISRLSGELTTSST